MGQYHVLIFCSSSDLQAIDKYENLRLKIKLGKDNWLPISYSNFYNFLRAVIQHRRLDDAIL